LELFLRELFQWGMVQTDPHFGNYKLRPEAGGDRIVLLDFGATRLFGPGFVESYREMLRGALAGDRVGALRGAAGIGVMPAEFPPPVREAFAELCEMIVEPFRGPYDWGASDLPRRVGDKIARNAMTRYMRIPPREMVFLHRRLAGVFFLIAALRARWDARPVLERHLQ
ncbi:MAG: AarF/UbiB family protein, partial [Nevskiaceae bacterium]